MKKTKRRIGMKNVKLKIFKGVALLLPVLTFLILVSGSYAIDGNGNIQGHVTVLPSQNTICFPQSIVVKEGLGSISCFIEASNADVHNIDVSSLRLGLVENPAAGIPVIPGSPAFVGDYNNNGVSDLFVQFDFNQFKGLLSNLLLPGNYHYRLTGNLTPFAFTQTSPVAVKLSVAQPSPRTKLIDYITSFNGKGGNILVANGFKLSKFTQQTNTLDGYVIQRVNYPSESVTSWGSLVYSSRGYLTVDFTVFPWLPPFFSMQVGQSFTVIDDGTHSCSSTTNQFTICQSSGWMIKQGTGIWADNGQIPVKTLIYQISPGATKILGFDSANNKILDIENIKLTNLAVSQTVPG